MTALHLENISNLEDVDSDDDIFEFLNFMENVEFLFDKQNTTNWNLHPTHTQSAKPTTNINIKPIPKNNNNAITSNIKPTTTATSSNNKRSFSKISPPAPGNHLPMKIPKVSASCTPEAFPDQEFHFKFRITKATFYKLVKTLESRDQYIENRPHNPIPLHVQLMIGLRYYATGSYQNELCEYFSVHQTTIGRIVHRISYALEDILLDFIKMPTNENEISDIQKNFFNIAQMENIIGVVGSKHVPLNSPHGNENIHKYKNNHGGYSLILQIICDSSYKVMHIDASSPGSMTNQQVFETCDLDDLFEKRCDSGILLGDNTYDCCPYLLTPLASTESDTEMSYNHYHRKTQKVIDTCFEMMLTRFPVLRNGLRVHIAKSITIILGLGVLHNFCVLHNDPLPPATIR